MKFGETFLLGYEELEEFVGRPVYIGWGDSDWGDSGDWHHFKMEGYDQLLDEVALTPIEASECHNPNGATFTIASDKIWTIKEIPIDFLDKIERARQGIESTRSNYEARIEEWVSEFSMCIEAERLPDGIVVFMSYVGLDDTSDTIWIPGLDREDLMAFWANIPNAYQHWAMEGESLPGVTIRLDRDLRDDVRRRLVESIPFSVWAGCMYRHDKCWLRGPEGHYQFISSEPPTRLVNATIQSPKQQQGSKA